MVETRKSNANAHPGDIVWKSQQKKRTKQEIAEDIAKAKARSIAVKKAAAIQHQSVIASIAGLRASIEQEEEAIQAQSNRPDLHYSGPNETRTASTQGLQFPVRARKYTGEMCDSAG
jgi:hypothetical protein